LVTNKTVFKDEKVLDIKEDNNNTLLHKRQELSSHFTIGDNTKFEE